MCSGCSQIDKMMKNEEFIVTLEMKVHDHTEKERKDDLFSENDTQQTPLDQRIP